MDSESERPLGDPVAKADPAAMFSALRLDDRAGALEAALDAYFGSACRPKRVDLLSPLAALFTRFAPGLVRQNQLAIPNDASRVFYVENQSCSEWALGDASDDPTVVRDGSVIEGERLSGFALQVVLFEASMGALKWCAGGVMNPSGRGSLVAGLVEVSLRAWTWPNDCHFFAAPGIVAHADVVAEDEAWVFASAETEERLIDLGRANGVAWTSIRFVGGAPKLK